MQKDSLEKNPKIIFRPIQAKNCQTKPKKLRPLGFPLGRENNQARAFEFFGQIKQTENENAEE